MKKWPLVLLLLMAALSQVTSIVDVQIESSIRDILSAEFQDSAHVEQALVQILALVDNIQALSLRGKEGGGGGGGGGVRDPPPAAAAGLGGGGGGGARALGSADLSHLSRGDAASLALALVCVCCAATAAGLTLGLMSMDPLDLQLKISAGSAAEKNQASRILPLLNNPHQLLCTLLLFNSLANEALPIFLDELVPEWVAVLLSVSLLLIFGEILPSAIFTGPRQLSVVSNCIWLVRVLMGVFLPLAWPLGWVLDRVVGHEGMKKYTRDELLHLVQLHHRAQIIARDAAHEGQGAAHEETLQRHGLDAPLLRQISREVPGLNRGSLRDAGSLLDSEAGAAGGTVSFISASRRSHMGGQYGLSEDEVDIMTGAIKAMKTTVKDIMVHMDNVYSVPFESTELNYDTMADIMSKGFSRVIVHKGDDPTKVVGYLLVKNLIVLDPEAARPIEKEWLKTPIFCSPKDSVLSLLNAFQGGKSHMAIVSHAPRITEIEIQKALAAHDPHPALRGAARPLGIVTFEDVIETIIQEEVVDETNVQEKKANNIMRRYIQRQLEKKRRRKLQIDALEGAMIQRHSVMKSFSMEDTKEGRGTSYGAFSDTSFSINDDGASDV